MAIDEALAESAGNGTSPPVIRLYGFSPPTLSLGRFQKAKGQYSARNLAHDGVTLVRRPTGGHAVLHDDELTYSVALPKESGLLGGSLPRGGARKREVYLFIARMLLHGLANLGVTGTINAEQRGDVHNPDCFGSAGEFEIAGTGGRKLIGSAQMTTRQAILQHGSIPLQNPGRRVFRYLEAAQPLDSHAPSCLNEETGRELTFEEVRDAFARAFREDLDARESDLLPEERVNADRILREKYDTDAWNLSC
ncbi:MAG: biotin/lipoate A/B protein ligase family protein [Spirochaetia bacterium]